MDQKHMQTQKSSLNAKDIGARFRSVRSLVNINRKTFCDRHGINRYTVQSWENGLHVSKGKNVEKFIEALAREGISCTADWLIEGMGDPPRAFDQINKLPNVVNNNTTPILSKENEEAVEELLAIYNKDGLAISFHVPDSTMAPKFNEGDLVIGRKIEGNISALHQKDGIIDLGGGRLLVRRAFIVNEQILLHALDQKQPTFVLNKDINFFPIIWHLISKDAGLR